MSGTGVARRAPSLRAYRSLVEGGGRRVRTAIITGVRLERVLGRDAGRQLVGRRGPTAFAAFPRGGMGSAAGGDAGRHQAPAERETIAGRNPRGGANAETWMSRGRAATDMLDPATTAGAA